MSTPETTANAAQKAALIDLLRDGCTIATAAQTVGCSVRTVYNWASADSEFAQLKDAALQEQSRTIAAHTVTKWRVELGTLKSELLKLQGSRKVHAGPAMAGNAEATAALQEIESKTAAATARSEQLTEAIASAEDHLAADLARELAATQAEAAEEASGLNDRMLIEGAKIDRALKDAAAAWKLFRELAGQKQTATRKSGSPRNVAAQMQDRYLMGAVFAADLELARALNLHPRFRTIAQNLGEARK